MSTPTDDYRQQVALFRYGLIDELVHLPPGSPGLYQRLHEKAAREYTIPGTHRTRVAAETLRDWLKRYRQGRWFGFSREDRFNMKRFRQVAGSTEQTRQLVSHGFQSRHRQAFGEGGEPEGGRARPRGHHRRRGPRGAP